MKKFEQIFESKREMLLKQNMTLVEDAADEVDVAQGLALNMITERLTLRDQEMLQKINDAMHRIKNGSYGICEDCEEEIPEKRLLAIPYCTQCVICAENEERVAKQYRN